MKKIILVTFLIISAIIYAQTMQCLGFKKNGNRCSNKTKNVTGYCYVHAGVDADNSTKPKKYNYNNNSNYFYNTPNSYNNNSYNNNVSQQCIGYTQSGNRCKRMTTNTNGRCYQH